MEELKYSGRWTILDKDYIGDLYIVKKKGIIRLVLTYKWNEGTIGDDENIPSKIDIINGTLSTEAKMALVNCVVIERNSNLSTMRNRVVIDGKYCINGLNFNSYQDIKFLKMEFRISKTLVWSDLNGFKFDIKNTSKRTPEIIKYRFKKTVQTQIDNGYTLKVVPYLAPMSYNINKENIHLGQYVKFLFYNRKEKELAEYMQLLDKIIKLIEVGIKDKVDIIKIEGYKRSIFSGYINAKNKQQKILYPIEIFSTYKYKQQYDEPEKKDMLFLLPELSENSIQIWYEKYEELKPIIELYIETIEYTNMSLERKFLNIVQALESYHMRFICNSKEDFKKRVEEVYRKHKILEYIYDEKQAKSKYILLKNRILDLFFKSDLLWCLNPMIRFIYFTNSIVDTRHYYTHYPNNKKYKALKDIELESAYYILKSLLENYILLELKVDRSLISKRLQEYIGLVKRNTEILRNKDIELEIAKRVGLNTELKNLSKNICFAYGIGEFEENIILDDDSEDLNYILKTKEKRNYKIIIINKRKTDDECKNYIDEIINKGKEKIAMRTREGQKIYILDYYTNRYRICVFEK